MIKEEIQEFLAENERPTVCYLSRRQGLVIR